MSRAILAGVVSSGSPVACHVRMSGGSVLVHQSWPEHIARSVEAIRQRRLAETQVLGRDGVWHDAKG